MDKIVIVYVTVPSLEVADTIANALVEGRIAACVNILPGVTSVYRWDGAVTRDQELLLLIKTVEGRLDELEGTVKGLHPYEVPEIVAVPIVAGAAEYLDWVHASVTPEEKG